MRSHSSMAICNSPTRSGTASFSMSPTALRELGLARGDRLLVVLQNRWEMATLHWACQFAGIVIAPLNWRAKPEEIDYCVTDAGVKAIVYEPVCADAVVRAARRRTCRASDSDDAPGRTTSFDELLVERGAAGETPRADADDLSLILYTSGTTGKAEGRAAPSPRTNAPARSRTSRRTCTGTASARSASCRSITRWACARCFRWRSSMASSSACARWTARLALDSIAKHALTCLYLVPTLYHDLLARSRLREHRYLSVTKLGFAGAPMNDGLLKRLSAAFKPELFVNHYGSSEVYTFSIDQDATKKPGSAGTRGHQHAPARRQARREVARRSRGRGEEGQIIADLLGDEAFEGYWNRPDADAKSLRDGWYFTGDTGYFDEDGDLYVSGRVDDMIISGGENISPVDIESVLSLHPSVDEVAVAGVKDERWGQRVVAFIKRARLRRFRAALDAWCRASDLVNFKRPRDYVFVDDIPKSPVGKILRRKLSAGEYQRDDGPSASAAHHTETTKE